MPELLYSEVVEVDERVVLRQPNCQLKHTSSVETGRTGEQVVLVLTLHLPSCFSWNFLDFRARAMSSHCQSPGLLLN